MSIRFADPCPPTIWPPISRPFFVEAVSRVPDGNAVRVGKDGNDAAGGSILGLMMLGAAKGDTIEIAVSGDGADLALLKLVGLVKDGFGED